MRLVIYISDEAKRDLEFIFKEHGWRNRSRVLATVLEKWILAEKANLEKEKEISDVEDWGEGISKIADMFKE